MKLAGRTAFAVALYLMIVLIGTAQSVVGVHAFAAACIERGRTVTHHGSIVVCAAPRAR